MVAIVLVPYTQKPYYLYILTVLLQTLSLHNVHKKSKANGGDGGHRARRTARLPGQGRATSHSWGGFVRLRRIEAFLGLVRGGLGLCCLYPPWSCELLRSCLSASVFFSASFGSASFLLVAVCRCSHFSSASCSFIWFASCRG